MPLTATTTVCLGAIDDALRSLLRDVLADMGLRMTFVPLWHQAPDLVLATLQPRDGTTVLAAAREVAGRAPVLAILPFTDERLARLARCGGATAAYALDTPLDALRDAVASLRLAGARHAPATRR